MSLSASVDEGVEKARAAPAAPAVGCPRNFLDNRFVYTVVSARARGLSIGINMNPDRFCNFDCLYCEVNRQLPAAEGELDVAVMEEELEKTIFLVRSGKIREILSYGRFISSHNGRFISSHDGRFISSHDGRFISSHDGRFISSHDGRFISSHDGRFISSHNGRFISSHGRFSEELLELRHVALSGDGEPTLCPNFAEAVQGVVHVRARHPHAFFKLALITNGTGLDLRGVQESLRYFTQEDEIWIKLDAGTQEYMERVNRSQARLETVISNILLVGRQRPVIIQSLFPLVDGQEPGPAEIDEYLLRLRDLKSAGAQISLVQIYSAARPIAHPDCGHLPLKKLSHICQRIKAETGLKAEVF